MQVPMADQLCASSHYIYNVNVYSYIYIYIIRKAVRHRAFIQIMLVKLSRLYTDYAGCAGYAEHAGPSPFIA